MTADAAAAEPATKTPREQRTRSEKDIMSEGPYELIVKQRLFLGGLLVDDHGS
jgi:hypothetical protein